LKSRQAALRVLLDTSFILPSLGINVGEEVSKGLKGLADIRAEIYYSHFSILESLWVAARLSTSATFDKEIFSMALEASSRAKDIGRWKRILKPSITP